MNAQSPLPVLRQLLAPLNVRKGIRVGCVGETGSGKTYALRALTALVARQTDLAYVIADKGGDVAGWNGQVRVDLADCRARPLQRREDGGSNVVVLTGDPFALKRVDVESVAADAWRVAAPPLRFRTAVVLDELKRASVNGRWLNPEGRLPLVYSEGREVGISGLWATQHPQEVAREAFGQSALLLFRMDARETFYLRRIGVIDRDLAEALPLFAVGDWCVRIPGVPFTPTRYRF